MRAERIAAQIRSGDLLCLRKGGNWRHVSVAAYAVPYIERYLATRQTPASEEPLFLSQKGGRLDRKALWRSLAAKQSQLNLKTGVHIFRHTLLTAIDQSGGSVLARDIAGYASLAVTNRYVHSSMQERQEAINATPLARAFSGK